MYLPKILKKIKKKLNMGKVLDKSTEKKELTKKKIYKVLLLTNRDSDNLGDQVIEATDIGLIQAVMENLGVKESEYKLTSRAAGMITKKYLATGDPELLQSAINSIKNSDVVIFGGAPLFNYSYQSFYERTAVTLELAQEYNKPVIFSAIGVERYNEENNKCQRLKKTLNFDCVKQITTRDDFDSLKKFIESDRIVIDKVSDPAVFTAEVFRNHISEKMSGEKKKVGIFILRANGFVDNKVNFTREDAAALWIELIEKLQVAGYDYELLTSGHFGDEAFMNMMITKYGVDAKKCVFNMNTPDRLIQKISSYDAVVSTRLHPSIISFSLGVPAIGLVWNSKVEQFYDSIGYGDRGIKVLGITADKIVESIEQSIKEGVVKNNEYLMSVYKTLFQGIKSTFGPEKEDIDAYNYDQLKEKIPAYKGTTDAALQEKLERKFRRIYDKYNTDFDERKRLKIKVKNLEEEMKKSNRH